MGAIRCFRGVLMHAVHALAIPYKEHASVTTTVMPCTCMYLHVPGNVFGCMADARASA